MKSIQAYAKLGIPIEYLTVQNEPSCGGDRATPAAMWTWQQERDVLLAVAKRFAANHITTKLWIMDHNFDMAQTFAKPLLDDPRIKKITTGGLPRLPRPARGDGAARGSISKFRPSSASIPMAPSGSSAA